MSKRHGATSVTQYEKLGYLPEAVFNFLALLGWSPGGEDEIMTKEEIIEKFSLDAVSKSPAVFDMEKLKWLNGHYIRQSSVERLVGLAIPLLTERRLSAGRSNRSGQTMGNPDYAGAAGKNSYHQRHR